MLTGSYGLAPPDLTGLLEPDAGRLARPVPRGAGHRKVSGLPDGRERQRRPTLTIASTIHATLRRTLASNGSRSSGAPRLVGAARAASRALASRAKRASSTQPTRWFQQHLLPMQGGEPREQRLLVLIVPSGSGPLFAATRRAEQRASTTAVDGRLPLRLEKEERRGYHRGSLLQTVPSMSEG